MRAFCLTVAEADEDQAIAALWEAGTAGVEVRAAPGGQVRLLAYFEGDATFPPAELLPASGPVPARGLLPPSATVEPVEVEDVDWVARFREGFHAFRAGRFTVAPPWDLPPNERATRPSASGNDRSSLGTLVVDPGRAFGTGTHETTRLCLAALERLAARRPLGRALDLGAGTGLLAVAAVRLGAAPVVASDIDPEATASSRHHARLNATPLHVVRADGGRGFRWRPFDLVLANLMALLLVDRAAEIRGLLAPGGALVLSGLLVEDVPFVREAFEGAGAPTGTRQLAHGQHARGNAIQACGAASVSVEGEWAALVYEDVPALEQPPFPRERP